MTNDLVSETLPINPYFSEAYYLLRTFSIFYT